MHILIILGASLLLSSIALIPAEKRIQASEKSHSEDPGEDLHSQRAYEWTNRRLEWLSRLGFMCLILYVYLARPELIHSMLAALSLK